MKKLADGDSEQMDLDAIVTRLEDISALVGHKDGLEAARKLLLEIAQKAFIADKDERAIAFRSAAHALDEKIYSADDAISASMDDRTELWDTIERFEKRDK